MGSAATIPHQSGSNGVVISKLQHSLYATAWSFDRPAPVRTFTTELAWAGSPQSPKSVISRWFIVIFHRRTHTGWTISIMGCEITITITRKSKSKSKSKRGRTGIGKTTLARKPLHGRLYLLLFFH